jgi:hypothetical protein
LHATELAPLDSLDEGPRLRHRARIDVVRIGTWNLDKDRGCGIDSKRKVVTAASAEYWVFTEPPTEPLLADAAFVCSPYDDGQRPWVRIEGPDVEPIDDGATADPFMAVAVASSSARKLIIVGSVLPWLSGASQVSSWQALGKKGADLFVHVLGVHADRVQHLLNSHPNALVVWAGDFNQQLHAPFHGASRRGSDELSDRLRTLGMVAWNASSEHQRPGLSAVDLICSRAKIIGSPERFSGEGCSDHAGYVVDIALS